MQFLSKRVELEDHAHTCGASPRFATLSSKTDDRCATAHTATRP